MARKWWTLAGAFGVALGFVYAPMSTAAMAAMPGEKVGIASGVLAMDRVLAVLCAAGVALTWTFVRDPETSGPDPEVAGNPPPRQLLHHQHHRRFHL